MSGKEELSKKIIKAEIKRTSSVQNKMKTFFANIWEIAEVVIISLLTVFFIRTFIVQPFLVSGASMEPTFDNGDYLLIDEATYYFREPQRGEVTVFKYPGDPSSFFIKRIIGLPGERVQIESGEIMIAKDQNSPLEPLNEAYLSNETFTSGSLDITLEANEYFVLGDNRSNSFDSRSWGPLSKEDVVGLVRLKIFPFAEFGAIPLPLYKN